jgi:hypothetical protein
MKTAVAAVLLAAATHEKEFVVARASRSQQKIEPISLQMIPQTIAKSIARRTFRR